MPRVSAKRQITLPIELCREVRSYVADGHITIIKTTPGAARGILSRLLGDASKATSAIVSLPLPSPSISKP